MRWIFQILSILISLQMFIKRLNKVYVYPPLHESADKEQQESTDKRIVGEQIRKNKVNKVMQEDEMQIFDGSFKAYSISIDPHGRLFCFYCQITDTIYIVSILTLLDYIRGYQENFIKTQQYSFKNSLKAQVYIKNPRPSLNIFQIKFSLSVQNTQLLVVAYYSGVVDIYSVVSGKKVDSLDIMEEKNWRSNQNSSKIQPSPLFNVNIIGHSIFISTYSGKQFCYEGKQLELCRKYPQEWIRLTYSEEKQEDEKQKSKKAKTRKVPLYQSKENMLLLANEIVESQAKKEKECQQITNSYDQYIKLESEKFSPYGPHLKFHLSLCERYLICKQQQSSLSGENLKYIIRSRFLHWNQIEGVAFFNFPAINQFWGIQIQGKQKKNKKKNSKQKQIDFIDYAIHKDQLVVAVVGEYQKQKGHANQNSFYIAKIQKSGNGFKVSHICSLTDAKSNILQIHWIGPNILLYLDASSNVYYVQISPSILMEQSL